jgi:hypothetical protein
VGRSLSVKRTGLSFAIAVGSRQLLRIEGVAWSAQRITSLADYKPRSLVFSFSLVGSRQRSHSRVRVSDSRLPFSPPPDSPGYGGGIRPCLHTGLILTQPSLSESKSKLL